eukprot:212737_1
MDNSIKIKIEETEKEKKEKNESMIPTTPIFDDDIDIDLPSSPIMNTTDTEDDELICFPNHDHSEELDSTPTSIESSVISSSNECDDKHLDYHLFNLSPAFNLNHIYNDDDDEDEDAKIFSDIDPTLIYRIHE